MLHSRHPISAVWTRALPLALACALGAGCAEEPVERAPERPAIEPTERRLCPGVPLPLTHIDAVVPDPNSHGVAVVGRRTVQDAAGAYDIAAWHVAVLDLDDPHTVIADIERTDPLDRPTPVAWTPEGLLITYGGRRLAPIDDPDGRGFETPWGMPPAFDPGTPMAFVNGERVHYVLGHMGQGSIRRAFVEAERADPARGTTDHVIASYGVIGADDLLEQSIATEEGMPIDLVGFEIIDWHIGPGQVMVALGHVRMQYGLEGQLYFRGRRIEVDADPQAGWFDVSLIDEGQLALRFDMFNDLDVYGLRPTATGTTQLVSYQPALPVHGSSLAYLDERAWPTQVEYFRDGPEFADDFAVADIERIGNDVVIVGKACLPLSEALYPAIDIYNPPPRCRPFASRMRDGAALWTVVVPGEALDHVLEVVRVDDRLVLFAGAYSPPGTAGPGTTPARVVTVGLDDGRCIEDP